MDIRVWNREFLTDFITTYKSFPVLWNTKSKDYCTRDKRSVAYDVLVAKLRAVEPAADVEAVKRKVNSLRTSFRKELNKVIRSRRSGSGEEYKPSLWYFDQLLFLYYDDMPLASNLPSSELMEQDSEESSTSDFGDEIRLSNARSVNASSAGQSSSGAEHFPKQNNNALRKRKGRYSAGVEDKLLDIIAEKFRGEDRCKTDRFDAVGTNVAARLRELPAFQRIIAEKLIGEVLFQAELGKLRPNSVIVAVPDQPPCLQMQQPSFPERSEAASDAIVEPEGRTEGGLAISVVTSGAQLKSGGVMKTSPVMNGSI